jgi:ligand-binding sensor domain-containing protein
MIFPPTVMMRNSRLPRVILRNIRQDRDGMIWFATFGGPIRYDGTSFMNCNEQVGLTNRRIFSLLEDRSGALWFGPITGGASRFTGARGLNSTNVYCTLEDKDANIWFGSVDAGACRYDGKTCTDFSGIEPVGK